MNAAIPFPVTKGHFFPLLESLSKKGQFMNDPVVRNTGQKSLPFISESRSPLSEDSQTRAESLADTTYAKGLFDNLQPLQVGLGESDRNSFDDLLQSHNSTQIVATKTILQPVWHQGDVTSTPEISDTVTNCDVAQLAKDTGVFSSTPSPHFAALDWILGPKNATSSYTRLLAALIRLEARANKDQDVAWAEDCRQTWIAIRKLESGECTHFSTATAQACLEMFGVSILQLQNKITARRMAKLGKEYPLWFDQNGKLIPEAPTYEQGKQMGSGIPRMEILEPRIHPRGTPEVSTRMRTKDGVSGFYDGDAISQQDSGGKSNCKVGDLLLPDLLPPAHRELSREESLIPDERAEEVPAPEGVVYCGKPIPSPDGATSEVLRGHLVAQDINQPINSKKPVQSTKLGADDERRTI